MAWTQKQLTEIIERNETWLLNQTGVVGVGVGFGGDGNACVEVLTDGLSPAVHRSVEQRFTGIPLTFTNTGPVKAL